MIIMSNSIRTIRINTFHSNTALLLVSLPDEFVTITLYVLPLSAKVAGGVV